MVVGIVGNCDIMTSVARIWAIGHMRPVILYDCCISYSQMIHVVHKLQFLFISARTCRIFSFSEFQ